MKKFKITVVQQTYYELEVEAEDRHLAASQAENLVKKADQATLTSWIKNPEEDHLIEVTRAAIIQDPKPVEDSGVTECPEEKS